MELKKKVGKNIKKYRKMNNYTQEKLAELIGIEVISISSIETGRYFPSPENLVKISKALNVSLSNIFDFEEQTTCEDYISNIQKKLNFIKNDKSKLFAIDSYINNLLY